MGSPGAALPGQMMASIPESVIFFLTDYRFGYIIVSP